MNQRISLFLGIAALAASCALAAEEKPAGQESGAEVSGDTTIATINGENLSLDLFRRFYTERLLRAKAEDTPTFQNRAFNDFVNLVVTAQDAQNTGIDKEKDFELALEVQRLRLLSSFALRHAANTREPSEEELQKAYEERYGKDSRIEYKARHILVKTEEEGEKLIDELEGGADFAELAKEQSLGPTGKDGGALPWFGTGQMVQPFTEATAALTPGEHTSEPVQTQFGWHVIALDEVRESEPPALEDVKDELAEDLKRNTLGSYVAELREKADLELNPDLIKISEDDQSKAAADQQ